MDNPHHAGGALVVNTVSVGLSGVLATSWLGWLPPAVGLLASIMAVAWYAVQLWESVTVKRMRRRAGWTVPSDDGV